MPCRKPGKGPSMPPKIRRGSPLMMSMPTALNTRPMQIEKSVLGISSPPRPMKVAKASSMSAKISGSPKSRATWASAGANPVNSMIETVPPKKDASAAATRALSALPLSASGRPSKVVATAVEAPGMPSMIELMAPPYMAP